MSQVQFKTPGSPAAVATSASQELQQGEGYVSLPSVVELAGLLFKAAAYPVEPQSAFFEGALARTPEERMLGAVRLVAFDAAPDLLTPEQTRAEAAAWAERLNATGTRSVFLAPGTPRDPDLNHDETVFIAALADQLTRLEASYFTPPRRFPLLSPTV